MRFKKSIFVLIIVALILVLAVPAALAKGKARKPAIHDAADRVVELQRTDGTGWDGTWYWSVDHTGDVTNLTGVTALGLLEAYNDTNDLAYLDASEAAAAFIMEHLGSGATGAQYHTRATAPDIVFLHRLAQVTGDTSYATRANAEWINLTATYPTAADLDNLFHTINRRSAWDVAFFMEAAYLSGDTTWANDAAAIIADLNDTFYYDTANSWYALNLAATIRVLVASGYGSDYNAEVSALLDALIGLVDKDTGVGGSVQNAAYAVMAFNTVGGAATKYGNDLGRWLAENQETNGGWLEGGNEYAEINGEALRALAMTIGSDNTVDQFSYGSGDSLNSSWVANPNSAAASVFISD